MNRVLRGITDMVVTSPPAPVFSTLHGLVAKAIANKEDLLQIFAAEIRLMIFEELLIISPETIFVGAKDFTPLDEYNDECKPAVPWQILATCSTYHDEAAPILYGKNKLAFCTGRRGGPGAFTSFPVSIRYMEYVTDLGIYFQVDNPKKVAAERVATFLNTVVSKAKKLEKLELLASSDRWHGMYCPWDIMFCDHPVAKAMVKVIESKKVTHLKIRCHDGARLYQVFGRFLEQHFVQSGSTDGRSITFAQSVSASRHREMPLIADWYPIIVLLSR